MKAMWGGRGRLRLKCDSTRAETRLRLPAKRTSPFKSAGASVQSTTGSRGVRISGSNGSNAGYSMFRGSVTGTVYPLHSPVSPSLPLPCVTVYHHISTGLCCSTHTQPRALEGVGWPTSRTRRSTRKKVMWYPFRRRLGGPRRRSGRIWNISTSHWGSNPRPTSL